MEDIKKIYITPDQISEIHSHSEKTYPYEGAGLMLGLEENNQRTVQKLIFLENARDQREQHNRYLITAEDMLKAEQEAGKQGMDILGIFHSHPDHPALPSDFDREYAIPWYSYLITSVEKGKARHSRCWRLDDDRSAFQEEEIITP